MDFNSARFYATPPGLDEWLQIQYDGLTVTKLQAMYEKQEVNTASSQSLKDNKVFPVDEGAALLHCLIVELFPSAARGVYDCCDLDFRQDI